MDIGVDGAGLEGIVPQLVAGVHVAIAVLLAALGAGAFLGGELVRSGFLFLWALLIAVAGIVAGRIAARR
jgi:hypothetical protein